MMIKNNLTHLFKVCAITKEMKKKWWWWPLIMMEIITDSDGVDLKLWNWKWERRIHSVTWQRISLLQNSLSYNVFAKYLTLHIFVKLNKNWLVQSHSLRKQWHMCVCVFVFLYFCIIKEGRCDGVGGAHHSVAWLAPAPFNSLMYYTYHQTHCNVNWNILYFTVHQLFLLHCGKRGVPFKRLMSFIWWHRALCSEMFGGVFC